MNAEGFLCNKHKTIYVYSYMIFRAFTYRLMLNILVNLLCVISEQKLLD